MAEPEQEVGSMSADAFAGERERRKSPETLRLRETLPSLTVSDIQASMAWYRDVMGFVVSQEWTHEGQVAGAAVQAGSIKFLLGQDDFEKGRDRKKGEGIRLFCITIQDVDQIANNIKARGGTLDHEPTDQPWGTRDFSVVDPDGFKISISTPMPDD